MFLGTYEHALDAKGRVILPAKFREELEAGAFLGRSLDGCLALYTASEFEKVAQEMQETARRGGEARNVVRAFAAGAAEATPDRQGRITIPAHLRSYAGLVRDIVVTGALTRVEIWDAARWREIDGEAERAMVAARPGLEDIGI
ncbi:MAG: division/cell wall cluster transcriptional repressor MraZ [Acidobacteria bacterium]|nr:division/cell wall cluster transcriptional repressor MraZ [Acidobacteriota bacterium]